MREKDDTDGKSSSADVLLLEFFYPSVLMFCQLQNVAVVFKPKAPTDGASMNV